MRGHNAGDYDYKGPGRTSNLRGRSAQRGDQETGDHGTIDSGLRRQSRSNGKGHGQRKSNQADGNSGNQIAQKFIQTVMAQAKNRLGEPAFFKKCEFHGKQRLLQVTGASNSPRKTNE